MIELLTSILFLEAIIAHAMIIASFELMLLKPGKLIVRLGPSLRLPLPLVALVALPLVTLLLSEAALAAAAELVSFLEAIAVDDRKTLCRWLANNT